MFEKNACCMLCFVLRDAFCVPLCLYSSASSLPSSLPASPSARVQVHKVAQLGLKPAPNSQDFRWTAFGSPPPPLLDAPAVQAKVGKRRDAGRKTRSYHVC